ncbi:ABC transporter permease [Pseudomonas granadensis]|uniref:ABC transporter permease n=1 Tax=Pseudomonas granadensis TaxID=1421430 RepID=UPI0019D24685|nr:ABC transporter permease [Pseudomonas granadensis]MBN6774524.1 ABC transporter permease [Pseudomonas granadensis]MBN6805676.1 ABC transporter permease [Pseudomonas granadensis]MBN6832550.1 ABC transporter permease [Pseudomonas granadensis]MBN6839870.1 ABC transporter permease [Pseudomonas granadensis]MBN6869245.1 ABC transporter permease [Pseudomonas granadensis]
MPDLLIGFWQGLQFYWGDISYLTLQHLQIVAVSGVLAIAIALPLGVWMSRPANQRYAMASMQVLNVGQAIPKLALLALAMSFIGVGSGAAIIGLFVATLLPVAVNTYEGLRAVPQHLVEAAEAMGMTPRETLWKVEIPNALNVIFAGIRTALAINVGTAPLAFLVGGGGLGELIFTGIDLNDFSMMLAGAVSTALLAIAVDLGCGVIQHIVVSRGLRMAGRE